MCARQLERNLVQEWASLIDKIDVIDVFSSVNIIYGCDSAEMLEALQDTSGGIAQANKNLSDSPFNALTVVTAQVALGRVLQSAGSYIYTIFVLRSVTLLIKIEQAERTRLQLRLTVQFHMRSECSFTF